MFKGGFSIIAMVKKSLKKILSKINFTMTRIFNGEKIKIPIINSIGLSNLIMTEVWMIDLLKILFKIKNGTFIDIGVNVGQSLIKSKVVNPDIKYIGFEPNPVCLFYVYELIKKNKFSDCTLIPVGLFDKDTILELEFISEEDIDSAASIVKGFRTSESIVKRRFVPVFNFENIRPLLNLNNISIIKIDVEGAELEVLMSLKKLILTSRPLILIEVLPVHSYEDQFRKKRQKKFEKLVSEMRYSIYRVIKTIDDKFDKLEKISEIGIHSDLSKCDYLLVSEDIENKVLEKSNDQSAFDKEKK